LYLNQEYQKAMTDFDFFAEIAPRSAASAYFYLGLSYFAIDKTKEALIYFKRALLDNDGHVLPRYERGKLYMNTQAPEGFVRVERQVSTQPDFLRIQVAKDSSFKPTLLLNEKIHYPLSDGNEFSLPDHPDQIWIRLVIQNVENGDTLGEPISLNDSVTSNSTP
jgi:tetratricopeptide (TPR) repeat protein